ncbi:SDR family oxidoreductase [Sphingopyxis panaciterrae]|uniref:SDR family oxidoreductase n=1 Tax=Sphingopyxis panaciterrae TaxID=363841 RepID=UPI0014207EFC|nr:SDR family oxidoreductase [Sphingopyxis panaciterrae]
MKILILGGYGVFGGRLAELLADLPDIELVIAGRDLARAERFCARYRGQPRLLPYRLDRRAIAEGLLAQRPDLVVDASGPFQDYGADRYRVVEACIAAGIDYLDFADAADFVFGMDRFDAAAKGAGVFALAGVSSFPALTGAVLADMAKTMDIHSVEGGIAPSPFAGIGLNVMRAVVGYAGAPVKLRRGGQDAYGTGLAESLRFTVAVPGRLPLRNIHFSLVDVPDLLVLPREYPDIVDIWMGAGPVPELLHRILNLLAKARARLRLPSLLPFSRLFYTILNWMKFGEHRGGMFIRVRGLAAGQAVERSWHLLAEADDGPYIPSMGVEGVVRKMLVGERPAAGARSSVGALNLADYEALFAGRSIYTGFRADDICAPLYRLLLDSAFDSLPRRVQDLHGSGASRRWHGAAEVRRGRGLLARAAARVFGFPKAAARVPVTVDFAPEGGGERWTRTFGEMSFSSLQSPGTGRNAQLLVERFGPLAFAMALVVEGGRLHLVPRRWSAFGIPMPRFLLPDGTSFESEQDGKFHFAVEISAPLIGLVVAYEGMLEPADRG